MTRTPQKFANDQYGTTKVRLARHFSISFMTLHTKITGGKTRLLSCVHKAENVSTALVLRYQNCELKKVVLVFLLLANLSIECSPQRFSKILENDSVINYPTH